MFYPSPGIRPEPRWRLGRLRGTSLAAPSQRRRWADARSAEGLRPTDNSSAIATGAVPGPRAPRRALRRLRMTLEDLDRWLDVYGRAWERLDVDAFVACFTEDALYQWGPWGEPLSGH